MTLRSAAYVGGVCHMLCFQRNVNSTINLSFSHKLLSPGYFMYCCCGKNISAWVIQDWLEKTKKIWNWYLSAVSEFDVQNSNTNLRMMSIYKRRVHHCTVFLQPKGRVWLTVLSPNTYICFKVDIFIVSDMFMWTRVLLMWFDKYTCRGCRDIWGPLLCCK